MTARSASSSQRLVKELMFVPDTNTETGLPQARRIRVLPHGSRWGYKVTFDDLPTDAELGMAVGSLIRLPLNGPTVQVYDTSIFYIADEIDPDRTALALLQEMFRPQVAFSGTLQITTGEHTLEGTLRVPGLTGNSLGDVLGLLRETEGVLLARYNVARELITLVLDLDVITRGTKEDFVVRLSESIGVEVTLEAHLLNQVIGFVLSEFLGHDHPHS